MDQPLAASGDRANAASLGRGCAIGYALAGSSGSDGYEFVASHAVPVGQSIVYFLIGLPGIDTVPQLRTTRRSRFWIRRSLVHALVEQASHRRPSRTAGSQGSGKVVQLARSSLT